MSTPVLPINKWSDLSISEFFHRNDAGELVLDRTTFTYISRRDGVVYYSHLPIPKKKISLEQAKESLRKIPNNEIYPAVPHDMPVLCRTLSDSNSSSTASINFHIKGPKLSDYSNLAGTGIIADRFLHEARICQQIYINPHPNLASFHGCIVNHTDRITALALTRYPMSLLDRLERRDMESLDHRTTVLAIQAGLEHLHSLGIAHNDINPSNLMVDESDSAVIIDYGSCMYIGNDLFELGTPGWNDGFTEVSSIQNDEIGLKMVATWLKSNAHRKE